MIASLKGYVYIFRHEVLKAGDKKYINKEKSSVKRIQYCDVYELFLIRVMGSVSFVQFHPEQLVPI